MDVMFYEAFQEEVAALKLFLPKDVDAGFTEKTIQESEDRDPPAGLISIRTQSVIPVEWSTKMSGVLTRSTGYDHIVAYREKIKAPVLAGYLPRYCSRAVAEHVVLMMMSLLRRFKEQISHFGAFNRNGITGEECFGKNLLVVGVGHIGGQVADIGKGLRMNVRGVDIAHKNIELEYTSFLEGMAWADVVVCSLPLTGETRGFFNKDVFKNAKKGIIFINVARGEISPIKDLEELLSDGALGGVGLDVYEEEEALAVLMRSGMPADENAMLARIRRLQARADVIFTPHNAFNTQEALERKAEQSVESAVLFLKKKTFPCPVPDDDFFGTPENPGSILTGDSKTE